MMKSRNILAGVFLCLLLLNLALVFPQTTTTSFSSGSTQFNNGVNANSNFQSSSGFFNSQTNSPSRNIQFNDPRYQNSYNRGTNSYNQNGQYFYNPPTGAFGTSGQYNYGFTGNNFGFSQSLCTQNSGISFVHIPLGGCTPAVVRSDLLEEQNVPVFCKMSSLNVNPLLDGMQIRGVRISGETPRGISGISYYPSRAYVRNSNFFGSSSFGLGNNFQASPLNDELGYIVVVLSQQPVEAEMPDFVEANITAIIDYGPSLVGSGKTTFYLDPMSDSEWQRDYEQNSFWNGKGYLRVDSIEEDQATISLYRDANALENTVTLRKGETSRGVNLGGAYCSTGVNIRLSELSAPRDSALLQVNGEQIWVANGDRIINDRCRVTSVLPTGEGGKIDISCPGERFELSLNGGKANFLVDGNEREIILNQEVRDGIFLGYIGNDNAGDNFAVLIKDSVSNTERAFASRGVYEVVQEIEDKNDIASIKNEIIKLYSDSQNKLLDEDVIILNTNIEVEGIRLIDLRTLEDEVDYNKNPLAKYYYDLAIDYYQDLFDLYPNEKLAEGEVPLAARGLHDSFDLSRNFQFNEQASELSRKLSKNYPDAYLTDVTSWESNQLFRYDRTNAKKIVRVDNFQYSVDLLNFRKPDISDASANFIINGREERLGLNEYYSNNEQNVRIQLLELNDDRVIIGTEYENDDGRRIVNRETLIFGDRSQTNVDGVNIRLIETNINKQAKIIIEPNFYSSGSNNQVSFPLRIGIEKRAIKLSPERTKEIIESLNEAIQKWNDINDKLGEVIKALKAACFATSTIMTVKNLFEGATGSAVARNRIMKGAGGWNDKCKDLVNEGQYVSLQQCLLDKNSEVENDIKIFSDQITKTNDELRGIQEQVGITHEGVFDIEGQVDSRQVEELYKQRFDQFCKENNNEVQLPGAGADKVKYSEICDWKGMTHEQRREILTLTNIKDSGGSDVLNGYVDRELGRITLDAQNTHEARISQIISQENSKKYDLGIKSLNPVGDKVTYGQIKTITERDRNKLEVFKKFDPNDQVIRVYIPKTQGDEFNAGEIGGKEVLVKVAESEGSGGVYNPVSNGGSKIFTIDGKELSPAESGKVQEYLSLAGLDKIKESDNKAFINKMVDLENLRVEYFDRAPFKGLPSIVPFDVKEGWYVKTSYTLAGFGVPYDESGRAANYYICNVGPNGLIEFKKSSDDICRYYNGFNNDLSFPGMTASEASRLVQRAQAALQDATRQFGQESISINGNSFKSGVSFDDTDGRCTDFMSAADCNLLFNVCDPVICPSSRCDLGGDYRVDNVIQTGIVGSLALCLPNAQEGVAIPICLTGVHAGLDGYISILNSTASCLQESLDTGRNVGICDEIKSVYLCDFFWRQAAPFFEVLLKKTFEIAVGQGARGGGEYLTVQRAWENTQGSIDYFTGQYAQNSIQAFQARSIGGVETSQSRGVYGGFSGGEICKSFISSGFGGGVKSTFEALIEPDSPVQYHGWFSENPMSTATVPPTSHYKVYYHIYAGKDIGAQYQVYLRDAPRSSQGVFNTNFYMVDRGYIGRGKEVDQARDFTATSGFKQLCISVNGQEECGFGTVSTSFLVDSLTDSYLEDQASETNIVSEETCIAGSPSVYSLANPNIQAGIQETIEPQLYNKGVVRVCSTENPGKQVLPTGEFDTTKTTSDKWKEVGYCDDPTIRCWLDTDSVKDVIKNVGVEERVLEQADLSNLGVQNYYVPAQSESILHQADQIREELGSKLNKDSSESQIDEVISGIVFSLEDISRLGSTNLYRARALFSLGQIHADVAMILLEVREVVVSGRDEVVSDGGVVDEGVGGLGDDGLGSGVGSEDELGGGVGESEGTNEAAGSNVVGETQINGASYLLSGEQIMKRNSDGQLVGTQLFIKPASSDVQGLKYIIYQNGFLGIDDQVGVISSNSVVSIDGGHIGDSDDTFNLQGSTFDKGNFLKNN